MNLEGPISSSGDTTGPDDATADGVEGETYVVFTVDDRGYALPVERVRAARPLPAITRLPTVAPHVLGVFHHRGNVLPLWDLHILFAADGVPPQRPHVLVVDDGQQGVGLVVQHVDEVITASHVAVEPPDASALPGHLDEAVAGRLRVLQDPAVPDEGGPPAAAPEASTSSGAGPRRDEGESDPQESGGARDARAAAVLERLAPVHLIDVARLFEVGCGRRAVRDQEATHGRS